MANPSFRASTTAGSASGLSQAILSPSSTAIGDVLTVVYTGYSSGTYSPTPTLPSGWTLLNQDIQTGSGYTVHGYTARFVTTAAGAQSFTFGTSMPQNPSFGCDLALVGCYNQDPTTPIDDSQDATVPNGTAATSPAATATVANDLILCFYIDNGNTGAIPGLPSGLTSAVAYHDSTNGTGIRVGYASLSASGTTPTYTSTYGETVGPSSGVFGAMFTVLVKAASGGTITASESEAASAADTPSVAIITSAVQADAASATDTSTTGGNEAVIMAEAASAADASTQTSQTAEAQIESASAADTSSASGALWSIVSFQQNTQKWHTAGWNSATNAVTVADGDGIIVGVQCWNNNGNGTYVPTMTPTGLTTIYDPSATYTGTAEPVYCQLFAALNLAAGTYTITPPDLQAQYGDGDMYVIQVRGLSAIRSGSLGTDHQGTGTTGNLTSTTSTLGSSAVAGDFVIGVGGTDNNTAVTTLLVTTPSGWTNIGKQSDGTNSPPSSFDYKMAAGGSETATWTWPAENIPVADSAVVAFVPASGNLPVASSESASASATTASTQQSASAQTDSGSALDTSTPSTATTTSLTDAATAADAPASSETTTAAQSDAGAASDNIAQTETTTAAQADAGTATDSTSTGNVSAHGITETGSATDAIASLILSISQIGESAAAAAVAAAQAYTTAAVQETGNAADVTAAAQAGVSSVSENAPVTDAPTSSEQVTAASNESSTATDQSTGGNALTAAAAEAGNATDALSATLAMLSAAQEIAAATDALTYAASTITDAAEAAHAADLVVTLAQLSQSITEAANAQDATAILSTLSEIAEWQYYAAQAARYFYAGMPFRSFYALCTSNMATQIKYAIDPGETKVATLDATADLPAGVTLTSITEVDVVVTRGSDANAAAIITASAINTTPVTVTNARGQVVTIAAGLCVQVEVSGCMDATWYEIRVTCSTTDPKNVEVLKAILTCTAS